MVIMAILTDDRSLLPIAPWIFDVNSLSAASLNADEPAMVPPLPDAEDDEPEDADPDGADDDPDEADDPDPDDPDDPDDADPDDPDAEGDEPDAEDDVPADDPDDEDPADADDPDDEQAARAMAAPAINATMPRYFLFIPNSFGYRRSDRTKPA